MPATVVSTVTMSPAFAQESTDEDDDNGDSATEAPVGGVAAGAGGAVTDGPGLALPATLAGGLELAGAGALAYRRRRQV